MKQQTITDRDLTSPMVSRKVRKQSRTILARYGKTPYIERTTGRGGHVLDHPTMGPTQKRRIEEARNA